MQMKFAQVPLEWALNGFGMQKKKKEEVVGESRVVVVELKDFLCVKHRNIKRRSAINCPSDKMHSLATVLVEQQQL